MKAKLLGILGTGKKRVGVIILSVVLTLALGTTTALAANAATGGKLGELFRLDNGKASYSTDGGQTWNEGTPADSDFHYSLDGGETWNDGLPPAGSENTLVVNGQIPDGTENNYGMAVKNVDGVMQYSTDGGKTWSTNVPDGVEIAEDGSIRSSVGNSSNAGTEYSLGGGETWNDELPSADNGGQSLIAHGTPPAEGDTNSFMTRNENGVISYSSDGGKTWSNTAPNGFNTTVNPDGSISVGR